MTTTTTKRPPIPCPDCGSHNTTMKGTFTYRNGAVGKRVTCYDCGRRFRHFKEGDKPPPFFHQFDDATFMRILRPDVTLTKLARELGCSEALLGYIRCGKMHANRMPDVKRHGKNPPPIVIPDGPNCWHCSEWRETYCAMGFPDPQVEGPRFAADCSLYPERCVR
jgi:hypothetical protein